jgi:hypothetical protein
MHLAHDPSIPRESNLRVQFLKVGVNEPLLRHFNKLVSTIDKVPLALEWAVVDLPHELDGECDTGGLRCVVCSGHSTLFGILRPGHEGSELEFMGQYFVLVGLGVGAAEDGRHDGYEM